MVNLKPKNEKQKIKCTFVQLTCKSDDHCECGVNLIGETGIPGEATN